MFAALSILSEERRFYIKKLVKSYLSIMSSSDASFDSSSDSETAETEVEYDLEVEVMSNVSEQKDTSDDDEPEDVYTNEPLADENWLVQYALLRVISPVKRNWVTGYALFLVSPVAASENNAFIWHFLSFYRSKDCPKLESDQWPGMTTQTALYPDFFK